MYRNRGPYYPSKGLYLLRGRKGRGNYRNKKDEKGKKKKDYCFIEFRE
jgi:hypothetical protein